ncbi:MAG: hypothetical protein JOZ89_02610, partial [Gammaproteobacteria bacterium]|nr:hypothetical protein [Gammaproteobacteria bacterium]
MAALGLATASFYCGAIACAGPIGDAHAHIEFLTPSLVRLQYSPQGHFVEAPTAVAQKRDWPAVTVHVTEENGWLVASSGAMTVRYRLRSGAFSAANLEITWRDATGGAHAWHPGDVDRANLGGLTYSLDNISAANLPAGHMDLESPVGDDIPGIDLRLPQAKPGLLSRSGYAFIDDSTTPLWNRRTAWIEPRAQPDGQDWYLFVYDRNYRKVLSEYAQLCGPIPMIPRYTLGAWITDLNFEYFPASADAASMHYGQRHLMEEISKLRDSHIPLDVLVLDFAWHSYGWEGGYDWSPLIPHPGQLISWLRGRGVKLSLNDHPGYVNTRESVLSYSDSHAPAVLKALGRPPPEKPSFDLTLREWSFAADAHGAGYRARVQLPPELPGALYLYVGETGGTYRVLINGQEAGHSEAHWPQRLTYADITRYVIAGKENRIELRFPSKAGSGGMLRGPVTIRNVPPPERIYFDLSDRAQAEAFMRELHLPLMQQGVGIWWVDGGSGAADMPGLDKQLWTNKV